MVGGGAGSGGKGAFEQRKLKVAEPPKAEYTKKSTSKESKGKSHPGTHEALVLHSSFLQQEWVVSDSTLGAGDDTDANGHADGRSVSLCTSQKGELW